MAKHNCLIVVYFVIRSYRFYFCYNLNNILLLSAHMTCIIIPNSTNRKKWSYHLYIKENVDMFKTPDED